MGSNDKSRRVASAQEILALVKAGGYRDEASGEWVDVSSVVEAAVAGSRTFTSDETAALLDQLSGEYPRSTAASVRSRSGGPRITVSLESTQEAACRLTQEVQQDRAAAAAVPGAVPPTGFDEVAVLNFASARSPGGGISDRRPSTGRRHLTLFRLIPLPHYQAAGGILSGK